MKTKEQVKNKLSIEKAKASLNKKAKNQRENWILIGFFFGALSFSVSGFLWGISIIIFHTLFKILSIIFIVLAYYIFLDLWVKVDTNARVNFIVENNINERIRK